MREVGLFASVVVVFASLGCAPDWEGVFGGGSDGGVSSDGGATSSAETTSTTSASGPTTTTTSAGGATTTSGPDAATTTTSGPDAATTTTSGPDAATTTTSTTSGEPTNVLVDCGGAVCDVTEGGACCLTFQGQSAFVTCQPEDSQCESAFSTSIQCDGPFDCDGGKVCCAVRDRSGQFYERTSCESRCDGSDRVICDPSGPACQPIVNNQGQTVPTTCQQSQLLPAGYEVCAGN